MDMENIILMSNKVSELFLELLSTIALDLGQDALVTFTHRDSTWHDVALMFRLLPLLPLSELTPDVILVTVPDLSGLVLVTLQAVPVRPDVVPQTVHQASQTSLWCLPCHLQTGA